MTTSRFKAATTIFLSIFGSLMLVYATALSCDPIGEFDDYTLPIASMLNSHHFCVTLDDVAYHQKLFPSWAQHIKIAKNTRLSGYKVRNGSGYLAWYFPTYGIVCIPITLILKMLRLPTVFAFPFTNLLCLLGAVLYVAKRLNADNGRKFLLLLLLTVNPIVFYISWPSAEVLIYSMLVMGLTAWHNGWKRRAALFISIAGTLNPVILAIGIVMIIEYAFGLLAEWKTRQYSRRWLFSWRRLADVVKYACCYVIGVVPLAFNFYHTGHINLTASITRYTTASESTFARFIAYLFDANFGILPYFPFLLSVALLLVPFAIVRKKYRYLVLAGTFFVLVWLFSLMTHINSGMSGIARYNAWAVTLLIFAVALPGMEVIRSKRLRRVCLAALWAGVTTSIIIIFYFSPHRAHNTAYTRFTPIAEWLLDHAPELYSPMASTFNSRIINVDGAYDVKTPLVYCSDDGYVRKILASKKDVGRLREMLASDNPAALSNIIARVGNFARPSYVSARRRNGVYSIRNCRLNEAVCFSTSSPFGRNYIISGVNSAESWGSWTQGHDLTMLMSADSQAPLLHADIQAGVYNNVQSVQAYVNGRPVYENHAFKGGEFGFDFENPGANRHILIRFHLPDAVSPTELGYGDGRTLGLGLTKMTISEAHYKKYSIGGTIDFSINGNNATNFILRGFSWPEAWGTWTSGKSAELLMECDADGGKLHADIACDIFTERQKVNVYVNDAQVFTDTIVSGGVIQFDFNADRILRFRFELPNAVSPSKLYDTADSRLLALGFKTMCITHVE